MGFVFTVGGNTNETEEPPDQELPDQALETQTPEPKKSISGDDGDETTMSLEDILATETDKNSYKISKTCINTRRIKTYEVLSRQNVVLEMRGGEKYLITTKIPCHGMSRHATLSTQQRSSVGFCQGDTIRWGFTEFGTLRWGVPCSVQRFEPVTDYQIERLKEAIKSGRVK